MERPRTYASGFVDGWLSVLNEPVPPMTPPVIEEGQDEYMAGFEFGRSEALYRQAEARHPR